MERGPPMKSRREEFVARNSSTESSITRKTTLIDILKNLPRVDGDQRYESAMQNNAILQAIQAEGNATRQMIQQDKIDGLQQKVQTLEMQNAMAGVVRYPMSTAYNAGFNPFCNCGNNYGCCGMAA